MTIESIMQLVGQCAFPIVMCICMFKNMTETSKETRKVLINCVIKLISFLDHDKKE